MTTEILADYNLSYILKFYSNKIYENDSQKIKFVF